MNTVPWTAILVMHLTLSSFLQAWLPIRENLIAFSDVFGLVGVVSNRNVVEVRHSNPNF
jgi:hypothetical protein